MRRTYVLSLAGSAVLAAAAFLPWLRLGDVGLPGVPDPAGYFVAALGVLGLVLSLGGLLARRNTLQVLLLVGLSGLTTLAVVWQRGPSTIADRAQARADAIAIVDNVPAQPVPAVTVGVGLIVGVIGAATMTIAGLRGLPAGDRR
jgi:hypothetical protein